MKRTQKFPCFSTYLWSVNRKFAYTHTLLLFSAFGKILALNLILVFIIIKYTSHHIDWHISTNHTKFNMLVYFFRQHWTILLETKKELLQHTTNFVVVNWISFDDHKNCTTEKCTKEYANYVDWQWNRSRSNRMRESIKTS